MSADRELRSAAVLLAADLPGYAAAQPRLIPDDEEASQVAFCIDHPEGTDREGVPWLALVCGRCVVVECHWEELASLLVALLRARRPLAALLEDDAQIHESMPGADEGPPCLALTAARAVLGQVAE